MPKIQNQIKLPISVALEVVLQGLRIRLGRSVVTITGVICGIAFLMSILTGQLIKQGVSEEDAKRAEVDRINNFMKADLPTLDGKNITLIAAGMLSEVETRVLERIIADGAAGIKVESGTESQIPRKLTALRPVPRDQLIAESAFVLVMGGDTLPDRDWRVLLGQTPLALTTPGGSPAGMLDGQFVKLSRELTEEELARRAAQARKDKFRSIWIGAVALLVTVIGITNAMLMSVTERFREIGTMKCLGALSAFIRQIFLLESSMMGLSGGIVGAIVGALFSIIAYALSYGISMVAGSLPLVPLFGFGIVCVIVGIVLSVVAALYPAHVASNMVPAHALRSNV
ncbi:MAG TPA: hypothetical protein DCR55_02995 [Lentisphaeria bacterium]|nr:hypothetical protein [Lentisphaeria bacterium]